MKYQEKTKPETKNENCNLPHLNAAQSVLCSQTVV